LPAKKRSDCGTESGPPFSSFFFFFSRRSPPVDGRGHPECRARNAKGADLQRFQCYCSSFSFFLFSFSLFFPRSATELERRPEGAAEVRRGNATSPVSRLLGPTRGRFPFFFPPSLLFFPFPIGHCRVVGSGRTPSKQPRH